MVACRLTDMVLGTITGAWCDKKLVDDDRFDDLTTVDIDGRRERIQFKHTSDGVRILTLDSFTTDRRSLQLDRLLRCIIADREGPGSGAVNSSFRLILADQAPTGGGLLAVLKSAPADRFLEATRTQTFRFDAASLWSQKGGEGDAAAPFAFVFGGVEPLDFEDLAWACEHLTVELEAPQASLNLAAPGPAEQLLLTRVHNDVGAESFPNVNRSAVDVAEAFIAVARAARETVLTATAEELLRRARLRTDFGAVARAHPVDHATEISRPATVEDLCDLADGCAGTGGYLLIEAPPGHGKSWVCQQVLEVLRANGWRVAEHYCYLGDSDGERSERVLTETILGSLLGRLATEDRRIVSDNRPYLAADEETLVAALARSIELEPDRKVALVVDGIDHITRVRSRSASQFDPSRSMADTLAGLNLPPGVVLIVLSQPGGHLQAIAEAGAVTAHLPGLDRAELKLLAARRGVIPASSTDEDDAPTEESQATNALVDAIALRSDGNALYATYLCRELQRSPDEQLDSAAVVLGLPPFDGTLKSYYDLLYNSLSAEAAWVAEIVAIIDFAVTRAELRAIRPDAAHHIDAALDVLAPVLIERAAQGGIRVYHESFARYLRTPFQSNPTAYAALISLVTHWLEQRGLFSDTRAFQSLLQLLADAGDDARVLELIDRDFVSRAVAGGFVASAIGANLATSVGAAARLEKWHLVVRFAELARAADTFHTERFESRLAAYVDVPATVLGADVLAERLANDDRPVMPGRDGLLMCAALDSQGAVPPWRVYLDAYWRELEADNTLHGDESSRAVELASLRGQLRINGADINWSRAAQWLAARDLEPPTIVAVVLDTHGWQGLLALLDCLAEPADAYLAAAEALLDSSQVTDVPTTVTDLANAALTNGPSVGSAHRLLAVAVDPHALAKRSGFERQQLLSLTRDVQESSSQHRPEVVATWLDAAALAARLDPLGIGVAEALIDGEGWFCCWLRFSLSLNRAEAEGEDSRSDASLNALRLLTADLRPFVGDPRACDLHSLHPTISQTIERAMAMINDPQWPSALEVLDQISSSITTTLFGELSGPVPPDFVLDLAVRGANPARLGAAEKVVTEQLSNGGGNLFYSDIAEFRLQGARLALAAGDKQLAEDRWQEACKFLTAYGWHKDITIYEVLDPFEALIEIDPTAARKRMPGLQALCERVPVHTDLKETRGAWGRWLRLLAKVDPASLGSLAAAEILEECNDANELLNGALEDLWREHQQDADPLVAGALRLSLGTPMEKADASALERLASASEQSHDSHRLLIWLLARLDERPVKYSYTNSDEIIAEDDALVAEVNEAVERFTLPEVVALRRPAAAKPDDLLGLQRRQRAAEQLPREPGPTFAEGLAGLVKAVREWRRRPYDTRDPAWDVDRFANTVGYRIIDLAADGRTEDAAQVLTALADASREGHPALLRNLAEGLERHGEPRLAARAYTLTWTRTRGGGGWLIFGGETAIDALVRATTLDVETTRSVLSEEVQRIVRSNRRGQYGISQALVYALARGALVTAEDSVTAAFEAWDEAYEVIARRAPRVAESDDPKTAYVPPDPDAGERIPGNLNAAMALATIAGAAHPARERKRRSLLAIRLLLDHRAEVIAPALAQALPLISDPATLTWLLRLLEQTCGVESPVLQECQGALRALTSRDLLTIRALARRTLNCDAPALVSSSTRDSEPSVRDSSDESREPPGLDGMLNDAVGNRITRAEALYPELRQRVRDAAASALGRKSLNSRLNNQLDVLSNRANPRWPDAFLTPYEELERVLQSVAAGARAALILQGDPVTDPICWEDALAAAIVDEPDLPLSIEAQRRPRPPLPPPPGFADEIWSRISATAVAGSEPQLESAYEEEDTLGATISIKPTSDLDTLTGGGYDGWFLIATVEQSAVKHPDRRDTDFNAKRYRGIETRNPGDRQALNVPPAANGELAMWNMLNPFESARHQARSHPLIGVDHELEVVGDGRENLAVPGSLLVPLPALIASLALTPSEPFTYRDSRGSALALIVWRAEYEVSDYHLAWPRTRGSAIALRPDLLEALEAVIGQDRLIVREFVIGQTELKGGAQPTSDSNSSCATVADE
jgi:hypothetical protein